MRFQVPQFIEVKSKIFGPLTLEQFIYLAGGGGVVFLIYLMLPFWLVFLLAIPIIGFSLALSFYKINNQPFVKILENALGFVSSPKLYVWRKEKRKKEIKKEEKIDPKSQIKLPKLSKSKLENLAWSLDIKEKI